MAEPEQTVREFFRLLALPDTKAAIELLDPEVVWRNTGLPTIKGRQVGGMLLDAEKRGLTVDITIHHAAADGDTCSPTAPTCCARASGRRRSGCAAPSRSRDGKITLWDDAFSWLDFTRGSLWG